MLTPDKIKGKEFQTTGRGSYRAEDVDSFLEEVYASYDQAFRENGEIIRKMSILANKVEEYKRDEDSLRQALLSAQKLADKIVSDAKATADSQFAETKAKGELILADANAQADKVLSDAKSKAELAVYESKKEAEKIIGDVNRKVTQETLVFEMLQKEVSDFRAKMMEMYKEHLTLLDKLPAIAEENLNVHNDEKPAEAEKAEPFVVEEEKPEVVEETVEDSVAAEPVAEETVSEDTTEEAQDDSDIEPEEGFRIYNYDDVEDIEDTTEVLNEDVHDDDKAEQFTLDASLFDKKEETVEDVNSGDTKEDTDDGFSIDMSDVDFEDEEDSNNTESRSAEYKTVDEKDELSDDDDEGALSFKSFFKKK